MAVILHPSQHTMIRLSGPGRGGVACIP